MRILVTGSVGFIGSHVSSLLKARGHWVVGLDSEELEVPAWLRRERAALSDVSRLHCDISHPDALADALARTSPDVVVHLAARPGVAGAETSPGLYEVTNVKGVSNLIDACRGANVRRIIHASSSSVYGAIAGVASETADPMPLGHYGRTKLIGEGLLQCASSGGALDVIILRPFSVIGPLGRPDMAPWRFAESLLSGQSVQLHDGAGRDFTSVHDVAAAFVLAAEASTKGCHVVNVGSGRPHTAFDLASGLADALGCRLKTTCVPLPPYMPMSTHADIGRAKALLGWRPLRDFSESVAEFGKWFLESRRRHA